MKPEMKKLIIANLPYLLFVYLFGKLGQTYRLAAGADLSEKLLHLADGYAPSMEELEARAKAGEQISLLDVAEAAKAEAKKPKQTRKTTQKQKKPSIRAQLAAAKEEQKKKPPAREKSKEMEV